MISHSPPMPSCNTQIFFFYMSSVERESAIFADSAEKWHVDKISLIRNSVRQFSYKDFFFLLRIAYFIHWDVLSFVSVFKCQNLNGYKTNQIYKHV